MTKNRRTPRTTSPGRLGHAKQPTCMSRLTARYPHATAR